MVRETQSLGDRIARWLVVGYCFLGLAVLGLDVLSWRTEGAFVLGSRLSMLVGVPACALLIGGAAVAVASRPRKATLLIAAITVGTLSIVGIARYVPLLLVTP
jgi:hypothetical protein